MSPVSRGRKKKPAKRQRRQPASLFDVILRGAKTLPAETRMVAAELWASDVLGTLWKDSWHEEFPDPDARFSELTDSLVEHAKRAGTPAALAALRAFSLVGEEWFRGEFTAAADELAATGVAEPAWSTEAHELVEVYSASDPFGDIEAIAFGYRQSGGDHALGVLIDHATGAHIMRIVVGDLPEKGALELAQVLASVITDASEPVSLTAQQARHRLHEPLHLLYTHGPDQIDEIDLPVDNTHPVVGLALLRTRVDALPTAEDIDAADAVEQFLASEQAKALPDKELARSWAETAVSSALAHGRLPTECGPLSLAYLLTAILPERFNLTDADLELLPEIVRAWAYFTADVNAVAHKEWDEQLPELLDEFLAVYRDPDAVEFRAQTPELFGLRTR